MEIREQLLKTFEAIDFVEDTHTYYLNGEQLPSVSSLLKNFYEEFDYYNIGIRYAEKMGLEPNDVWSAWSGNNKLATDKGHRVHLFGENYARWRYFGIGEKPEVSCKQTLGIVQFYNNLPDYLVPVGIELMMYNEELGYSGTTDIVLLNKKTDKLWIQDWKGLPLDTPILTTEGFKTMNDLKVGDYVFDKDGNPAKVKIVSSIHYNPCYKINFDNRESIIADHEHRWLISYLKQGVKKDKILTTEELTHNLCTNIDSYKIPKIYNPKPLNLPHRDLPIDPYVLGLWLADGSKACGIITKPLKRVWEEIEKRGFKTSHNLNGPERCEMRTVYGLSTELRKLNLLNNKHLPDMYLLSSYEQRLDLLRGFMDGDGYYHPKRRRFVTSTTSKEQVKTAVKLIASLGWKSTVFPVDRKLNGKVFKAWEVCFNTNGINPFLCRNQENIQFVKRDRSSFRNIKSVELTDTVVTKCIEVDSPSNTFLAGESLIVTHNTNKELINEQSSPLLHIDNGLNLRQDNLGKYSLQFSFYQLLLELAGFKVEGRLLIWLDEDKDNKKLYRTFRTPDLTQELLRLKHVWSPLFKTKK